ncbi:MAG: hypothetical protein R2688_00340 [Fimbriimonadaceae bacterium]
MRKHIFIAISIILAVFAVWGLTSGRTKAVKVGEKWLEDRMLTEVGEFELVNPMEPGSKISYKMDDKSYEDI